MRYLIILAFFSLSHLAFSRQDLSLEDFFKGFHDNSSNYTRASEYLNKAYQLSVTLKDSQAISTTLDYKGWLEYNEGAYKTSLDLYKQALAISKSINFDSREAAILNHMGNSYQQLGQLDSALYYHLSSLALRKKIGDQKKIGIAYNNIGVIYHLMDNMEKAEKNFVRAYKIYKNSMERIKLVETSINIMALYLDQNKYEDLLTFSSELLANTNEIKDKIDLSAAYFNRGMAQYFTGSVSEAVSSYRMALEMADTWNNNYVKSLSLVSIGNTFLLRNDMDMAYQYFVKADKASMEGNSLFAHLRCIQAFSDYYKRRGDFEEALKYKEEFQALNDSLYSGKKLSNVENVYLAMYEMETQNLMMKKEEVIQQHSWISTSTGILASMFILLLVGGWKRLSVIKRDRKKIEVHYLELAKSNISLSKDISERSKQLREVNQTLDNFIYRTSHDIRGPLATLKGLSQTAQLEEMDTLAKEYFKKFNRMTHNLDDVLTRLQDASMIKHKELNYETVNICDIVDECIRCNQSKSQYDGIKVEKVYIGSCDITSDKSLVHTSIDQLIDNAYNFFDYSAGSEPFIRIETKSRENGIKVRITDNGIGIPKESLEKIFNLFERASDRSSTGGIGLYLVKQALERLGGTINVKSSPKDRITEFEVFIPSHN